MQRHTALWISGLVTAFALVLVIGLAGGLNWFTDTAQAATPASADQAAAVVTGTAQETQQQTTELASLQQEVAAYKTQLQQAYDALQSAYDQISQLQAQGQQQFPSGGEFEGRSGREGRLNQFFGQGNDD